MIFLIVMSVVIFILMITFSEWMNRRGFSERFFTNVTLLAGLLMVLILTFYMDTDNHQKKSVLYEKPINKITMIMRDEETGVEVETRGGYVGRK